MTARTRPAGRRVRSRAWSSRRPVAQGRARKAVIHPAGQRSVEDVFYWKDLEVMAQSAGLGEEPGAAVLRRCR